MGPGELIRICFAQPKALVLNGGVILLVLEHNWRCQLFSRPLMSVDTMCG